MRFLADENFPGAAVSALRVAGHDVTWVRTECPAASDHDVIALAAKEKRVILTFDKDFGELAFRTGRFSAAGVVRLRLPGVSPEELTRRILGLITSRSDWEGHFSVVDARKLRTRPMPLRSS